MGGKKEENHNQCASEHSYKGGQSWRKAWDFSNCDRFISGYIKLFSKNPTYNVIIKHSKTKKTLSVPHKSMVQIR